MTSFGITIGCAMRPVIRGTFITYAAWQVAAGVMAVVVMLDTGEVLAEACKFAPNNGMAPISTTSACPQLVRDAKTVAAARELCESTNGTGRCYWTDRCTVRSPEHCEKTTTPGLCVYKSRADECRTADNHGDADAGEMHGVCAASGQCEFASEVWMTGLLFLCTAGMSLLAVLYVLRDSKRPLNISLIPRGSRKCEADGLPCLPHIPASTCRVSLYIRSDQLVQLCGLCVALVVCG